MSSEYVSPSNGRDYKTRGALNAHLKSAGHRAWVMRQDNATMKSRIEELESEVSDLKDQVRRSNDVNYFLVSQFRSGETLN